VNSSGINIWIGLVLLCSGVDMWSVGCIIGEKDKYFFLYRRTPILHYFCFQILSYLKPRWSPNNPYFLVTRKSTRFSVSFGECSYFQTFYVYAWPHSLPLLPGKTLICSSFLVCWELPTKLPGLGYKLYPTTSLDFLNGLRKISAPMSIILPRSAWIW
jgi:hypothetical protein